MVIHQKCDFERLQKYCNEKNVIMLNDYSNISLNGSSIIKGKCNYENCNNSFEKKFSYLLASDSFCKQCSKIVKNIKSKKTYLEKYGCNHASQSQNVKNKIISTNLKKYGCKYSTQSEIMKTKSVETSLKQYGVKHPMQNKEIKTKTENTNLKKYGCKNVFQNKNIKNNIKLTNIQNIGVDHNMKLDSNKELFKNTCLKKYGVENPSQDPNIKNKKIQTSLKNWGVEYPSQNAEVSEKIYNNSCKTKTYALPSGKIIKCQGYEPFAFRDLINLKVNENDIINKRTEVPKIWFIDNNNKKRRYYVDIYIPSQNKCIEVKAWYIYKKNENKNLLKKQAAIDLGYSFEFWIYDNKGNRQYNLENI
jgi:hypothetical protein